MVSSNLKKWSSKNPLQKFFLKRFLKTLKKNLPISSGEVLDVGCGEGIVARSIFFDMPAIKLTGVDISEEAIKIFRELNPNSKAYTGSADDLKLFSSNKFDLVMCLETLEHIKDYQKVLSELKRVSKKYILISIPYQPWFSIMNFLRGKNLQKWGDDPDHVNWWTKRKFIKILRKEGLRNFKTFSCLPWMILSIKI